MSTQNKINVAVVGATGMVGQEFVSILQEKKFPVGELKLFASDRSAGQTLTFNGEQIDIQALTPGCFSDCDVAFFSAGTDISLKWGPIAVSEGAFVIDNSSAFRMDKKVPLVVPEVNPHRIPENDSPALIANPNCSTIQLVVALKPLDDAFKLKSVIVSTYQSVSGAGKAGVDELKNNTQNLLNGNSPVISTFAHDIAFNNIPQIDKFDKSGFTLEELKVINETRKIMELKTLDISCTAVRTPTLNGHSEAVWVEFKKPVTKAKLLKVLKKAPGIVIQDDTSKHEYPLNRFASGRDPVYVGRIRQDITNRKRWIFWVVSDNVRKGAALNGLQIAKKLFDL